MALSNLTDLKASIIRSDGSNDIADVLDDAVSVTESRMFANEVVILKPRPIETRSQATLTTLSRFLALPPQFMTPRKFVIKRDGQDDWILGYRTPETLYETEEVGLPCYFTVTSQLEFDRIPDIDYTLEMDFRAEIDPLTDASPTNIVLTEFPQIYEFGCLWYINETVNGELGMAQQYEQKFYSAIAGANAKFMAGRGPTPVRRTLRSVP